MASNDNRGTRRRTTVSSSRSESLSSLDHREAVDREDDMNLRYAQERRAWPQLWKDARNSLADNGATSLQRAIFRDIILAVTDDLPSALQFVDPPLLASHEDIEGYLVDIRTSLMAQQILGERGVTAAQRNRLVESLQRAISIDPAMMNSWTPPTPNEGQSITRFLIEVQNSLQVHKVQHVVAMWEAEISQSMLEGAATHDLMTMRLRLDAMKAYVANGGEPYRPDDDLPADANEEMTLPAFDIQTRGYGFERPTNGTLPGQWRWQGTVGEGGNGYAGIWLQYDSSGRPVHRVVVKDCYFPGPQWDWPQIWYDLDNRVPNEVALAQRLNQCLESSNIVLCYGHVVHTTKRMFRVYLEYCPHGDLESLIEEHVKIRDSGFKTRSGAPFAFRIPIPALWAIFEALASAACLMHEGRLPRTPSSRHWDALLHMDIKPANIFLGSPDSRKWRGIPTAKLGDFGLITEIRSGAIKQSGTQGYIAPEREAQDRYDLERSLQDPDIATGSDVWSIGRVMHSLMNLHQDVAPWSGFAKDGNGFPMYSEGVREYYEDAAWELLDLVDGCLQPDPQDRTCTKELWNQIQEETTRGGNMKLAPLAANQIIWYKRDQYSLWAR